MMRARLILCALAALAGCASARPAQVQVIDATASGRNAAHVLRWCAIGASGPCGTLALGGQRRPLRLMPGRYRFELRDADGRQIDRFTYGIGSGARDALVLYGFAAPRRAPLVGRAARWLAGSDRPRREGFGPAHRMIDLSAGVHTDRADLRLLDAAIGTQTLVAAVGDGDTGRADYGALSDPVPLPPGDDRSVSIRFAAGGPPLAQFRLNPRRGERFLLVATALDRARTGIVVVTNPH